MKKQIGLIILALILTACAATPESPKNPLQPADLMKNPSLYIGRSVEVEIWKPLRGPSNAEELAKAEYGRLQISLPHLINADLYLVPAAFQPEDPNRYRHKFDQVVKSPVRVRGKLLHDNKDAKFSHKPTYVIQVLSIEPLQPKPKNIFLEAIENDSSSPSYVLITVINDTTKESRPVAMVSTQLLGAIIQEYEIAFDVDGIDKAKQIALDQKDRIFHFSKADALQHLTVPYDDKILEEMRSSLEGFSNKQIMNNTLTYRSELKKDRKDLSDAQINKIALDNMRWLYQFYQDQPIERRYIYQHAMAHALLERGLLPTLGSVSGTLYVSE